MTEDRKKADIRKAVETVLKKCGIVIPEKVKEYTVEVEEDTEVETS